LARFEEHWNKVKSGARRAYVGARERVGNIKWKKPSNTILVWTGSIFALLVGTWVLLNILLANPSTGTPMVN
jgi:hypothetical protein